MQQSKATLSQSTMSLPVRRIALVGHQASEQDVANRHKMMRIRTQSQLIRHAPAEGLQAMVVHEVASWLWMVPG